MSSLRWVVPGFVVGLVLAVAPACGGLFGADKCNASTCPAGCCSESGRCESGVVTNACGVNGNACKTCGTTEGCNGGVCAPFTTPGTDGGNPTDGGTDAGVCDTGTCNTCCSNGQCVAAIGNLTCGNGGGACEACTGANTCNTVSGTCEMITGCDSTNCAGCCDGAGVCQTGNTSATCGLGGGACAACAGTETCSNGTCQTATCGAGNCAGCCQNNQCQTGTAQGACGAGGGACVACSGTQTCNGGTCTGGTTCGAGNCNGCCLNNVCQPGTATNACGVGGGTCATCSGTQTCSGGTCQGGGGGSYGAPCTNTSQCSAIGAGAVCKLTTVSGNATYTGGYCTKPCTAPGQCGTTAECLGVTSVGEENICAALCNVGGYVCRTPGYTCHPITGGDACWISPVPPASTAPANLVGTACTADTQCRSGGSFPAGYCYPATNPSTGAATGFTGGYCTAGCTNNTTICGSTATCINFNDGAGGTFGLCISNCASPGGGQSTCRSAYVCEDLGAANGFCLPHCNNPGWGCGASATCNTATGYCE